MCPSSEGVKFALSKVLALYFEYLREAAVETLVMFHGCLCDSRDNLSNITSLRWKKHAWDLHYSFLRPLRIVLIREQIEIGASWCYKQEGGKTETGGKLQSFQVKALNPQQNSIVWISDTKPAIDNVALQLLSISCVTVNAKECPMYHLKKTNIQLSEIPCTSSTELAVG